MSFLSEFKAFAIRGNVIDLAVGVIIGGAFGKIVSSLVDDVLMPPLGYLMGRVDFSEYFLVLYRPDGAPEVFTTLQAAKNAGAVAIGYGNFINVLIQFVIVAFAIFILIRQINKLQKAEAEKAAAPPAPTRTEVLLEEIRDSLKK